MLLNSFLVPNCRYVRQQYFVLIFFFFQIYKVLAFPSCLKSLFIKKKNTPSIWASEEGVNTFCDFSQNESDKVTKLALLWDSILTALLKVQLADLNIFPLNFLSFLTLETFTTSTTTLKCKVPM